MVFMKSIRHVMGQSCRSFRDILVVERRSGDGFCSMIVFILNVGSVTFVVCRVTDDLDPSVWEFYTVLTSCSFAVMSLRVGKIIA